MHALLAHITATDVGFGVGLFLLGLLLGALVGARLTGGQRPR